MNPWWSLYDRPARRPPPHAHPGFLTTLAVGLTVSMACCRQAPSEHFNRILSDLRIYLPLRQRSSPIYSTVRRSSLLRVCSWAMLTWRGMSCGRRSTYAAWSAMRTQPFASSRHVWGGAKPSVPSRLTLISHPFCGPAGGEGGGEGAGQHHHALGPGLHREQVPRREEAHGPPAAKAAAEAEQPGRK